MPRVVRGGVFAARTFDLFRTAIRNPRPGQMPFLLVDSETAVTTGQSAWRHLGARDGWDRPPQAGDDQAFLMVQVMETWFLADRNALRAILRHIVSRKRASAVAGSGRRVEG